MNKFAIGLLIFISTAIFSLNLQEAYDLAMENNPEILAAHENAKSANLTTWQTFLGLVPTANFTTAYTIYEPRQNMGLQKAKDMKNYGFNITQPIFSGGKLWFNFRISKDLAKIADKNLDQQYFTTIATVENYYFDVLKNKQLLEIAEKSMELARKNVEIAKLKFQNGVISRTDFLQFQTKMANKELTLLQTQSLFEVSRRALANYLQIEDDFKLEDIPLTSYEKEIENIQNIQNSEKILKGLWDYAKKNNPNLQIANLNTEVSKKKTVVAAGSFLPNIQLSYNKTWDKYDYENDFDNSSQLGIRASIPLFPIVDNGLAYASAKSNQRQVQHQREIVSNQIELALENSYYALLTSAKAIRAAEVSLQLARETYTKIQEKFRKNIISTNELLDAEIAFTSAENQYILTVYKFLQSRTELKKVLGSQRDSLKFWEE